MDTESGRSKGAEASGGFLIQLQRQLQEAEVMPAVALTTAQCLMPNGGWVVLRLTYVPRILPGFPAEFSSHPLWLHFSSGSLLLITKYL